jgi:adenylate kinase family enzyme
VADVGRLVESAEATYGGWVADGNYLTNLGTTLTGRADSVVWLDYSRAVVLARVVRRTAGRLVLRRRLWHGNRERWSAVVSRDPETNILLWSWTRHAGVRDRLAGESDERWTRLRRPREARRWLRD